MEKHAGPYAPMEEDQPLFIQTACIQNILHQTCQPNHLKCKYYVEKETRNAPKGHTRFTAFLLLLLWDYPGLSMYRLLQCDSSPSVIYTCNLQIYDWEVTSIIFIRGAT